MVLFGLRRPANDLQPCNLPLKELGEIGVGSCSGDNSLWLLFLYLLGLLNLLHLRRRDLE